MVTAAKYCCFASTRRFGVELEVSELIPKRKIASLIRQSSSKKVVVSGYTASIDNKYWHVKTDATCGTLGIDGPCGFEISSFVGQGLDEIKHISKVSDVLRANKIKTTDYCGLHVHAEVGDLTPEQIGNLLAYWFKIESIFALAMPSRRLNNSYCQQFSERTNLGINLERSYLSREIYNLCLPTNVSLVGNDQRRVTLNLVNYARAERYKLATKKTIELRWPEGSLCGQDVKNWIILFLNFIESCKDRKMPKNLKACNLNYALRYLGLGHEAKTYNFFCEDLYAVKSWFLNRIVRYSPNSWESKVILQNYASVS